VPVPAPAASQSRGDALGSVVELAVGQCLIADLDGYRVGRSFGLRPDDLVDAL